MSTLLTEWTGVNLFPHKKIATQILKFIYYHIFIYSTYSCFLNIHVSTTCLETGKIWEKPRDEQLSVSVFVHQMVFKPEVGAAYVGVANCKLLI